jgi:trk system potassium uptake protein TrkH
MQTKIILRMVGLLICLFSFSMLPPALVSLIYEDGGGVIFIRSFFISLFISFVFWYPNRYYSHELRIRSGFLIVVLFWVVLGTIGAIPFMLLDRPYLSITDSFFESFSALTTTGATVIVGLDNLPKAILFYRHLLQWFGGMGIIVLAVAILPLLGIGGMQLYRAETPGPVKDTKITPRIAETAKALWYIYLTLTVLCAFAYWLAGMSIFDAIGHAFSTIAIGGFSSHDASLGYFNSEAINIICAVFLLISSINFSLHFLVFSRGKVNIQAYLYDAELRFFLGIQLVLVVLCFAVLYGQSVYGSASIALEQAFFQAVSISTTAGFATDSFAAWPLFLPVLLLLSSFVGGCAGSTGGGLKVIRVVLLMLQASRELKRLVHPRALFSISLGTKALPERVIDAVWGFFSAYLFVHMVCMLLLLATGLDATTAISATTSCLNNLGPGLGEVTQHYANINPIAKWCLILAMLFGRLEVFTLLVLFTPTFWKH